MESSIGRRPELARRNLQLDEIKEIGRYLAVEYLKVRRMLLY